MTTMEEKLRHFELMATGEIMTCLGPADRHAMRALLDEFTRLKYESEAANALGDERVRKLEKAHGLMLSGSPYGPVMEKLWNRWVDQKAALMRNEQERCKHGVWLADRCFECDPNTGTENREGDTNG